MRGSYKLLGETGGLSFFQSLDICVYVYGHIYFSSSSFLNKGSGTIRMLVKSTVNKEVGMSAGSYDTWNYTKRFRMKKQFVLPRGRRNKMI